jgi:Spy/CpxP family protein refolding chaperone
MRAQRRETFERIQAVLTPEQRERFEQLREERRDRRGGREGERGWSRDPGNF